jgi:transcription elongation GreA/GreB family factor
MENSRQIAAMGEDQFEEWFLAGVASETMPVDDMLGALRELRQAGLNEQSDSWAELMEEALAERGRADDVVRVLKMRADWHVGDAGFRAYCEKKIAWLYRNDPLRKKFAAGMGIAKGIPLQECFRRLGVLQRLAPGVLCLDNTWGVGVVKNVDAFYERVTIDFDKKRGHEMSFAYAAEALQFVDEDHLLARKNRDAAALIALAESQPAEVVKIALRSYGPLPVSRLQDILSDGIVKPEAWKAFWEPARKALKDDPLVIVPAKRTEPITLLDKEMTYDAQWFAGLASERTPEGVFARLEELEDSLTPQELDDHNRRAVGERLAFLMLGFGDKDVGIRVQVILAAWKWNVPAEQVNWAGEASRFLSPGSLLSAAAAISSRRLEEFLRFLVQQDRTKTVEALTAALPTMTLNVLNPAVSFLLEEGAEAACAAVFKEQIGMRRAGVETLFWLAKRPDRMAAWGLGTLGDLAFHIIPALEHTYNFERLKAANQLAELVQQKVWIEAAVDSMNDVQRSSFVRSLRAVMGRIPADAQTMIGRIVIRYPELAGLLVEKKDEQGEGAASGGFTSWRMVKQRQQQLEKLVNEDIPKNSRDIGVARSYGDLRENFEYKAAKEQQSILLRRREEIEQGLKDIQGTDFSAFQTDVAGLGTRVLVQFPDGRTQQFYILGEWDQDTELGIISCGSRMGKALMGRLAGEEVQVPGEAGEMTCLIMEVAGLPEAIRAWAKGS